MDWLFLFTRTSVNTKGRSDLEENACNKINFYKILSYYFMHSNAIYIKFNCTILLDLFIYYHRYKGIQLTCKIKILNKHTHIYKFNLLLYHVSCIMYHVSWIQFRHPTIYVLLDVDLEHLINFKFNKVQLNWEYQR